MRLRKLDIKDAPFMLEWMHDEDVTRYLATEFTSKNLEDCERFITTYNDFDKDLHLAIVDENDEYMGTVSLKHIDNKNKTSEFAITIRKCAMGKGYANEAMDEILNYGLNELKLDNIYWCVSNSNYRAVKFYDKNRYERVFDVPENITCKYSNSQLKTFYWYKKSK